MAEKYNISVGIDDREAVAQLRRFGKEAEKIQKQIEEKKKLKLELETSNSQALKEMNDEIAANQERLNSLKTTMDELIAKNNELGAAYKAAAVEKDRLSDLQDWENAGPSEEYLEALEKENELYKQWEDAHGDVLDYQAEIDGLTKANGELIKARDLEAERHKQKMSDLDEEIKKQEEEYDDIKGKMRNIKDSKGARLLPVIAGGAKNVIRGVGRGAKTVVTGAGRGLKRAKDAVTSRIRGAGNTVKKMGDGFGNLVKRLVIFGLIVKGLKEVAEWIKKVAETNDETREVLGQLKGAWLTLLAPLTQAVLPVITELAQKLTQIVLQIAQFTAGLFGMSLAEAAASAEDLYENTKAANGQLAKFDELTVIGPDDNTSFDFANYELQESLFFQKLRELFESDDWRGIGSLLAQRLNELISMFDPNKLAGRITDALNKAFNLVAGFLNTFDFGQLGNKIGEFVQTFIDNIDADAIADSITGAINGVIELLQGFVDKLDPVSIGQKIGDFIYKLITDIDWSAGGYLVGSLAGGLLTMIVNAIDRINIGTVISKIKDFFFGVRDGIFNQTGFNNWTDIGKWLAEKINKVIGDIKPEDVAATISTLINDAVELVLGLSTNLDWEKAGKTIGDILDETFKKINWENLGLAIGTLAKGLGDLIIGALGEIDFDYVAAGFNTAVIIALKKGLGIWEDVDEKDIFDAAMFNAKAKSLLDDLDVKLDEPHESIFEGTLKSLTEDYEVTYYKVKAVLNDRGLYRSFGEEGTKAVYEWVKTFQEGSDKVKEDVGETSEAVIYGAHEAEVAAESSGRGITDAAEDSGRRTSETVDYYADDIVKTVSDSGLEAQNSVQITSEDIKKVIVNSGVDDEVAQKASDSVMAIMGADWEGGTQYSIDQIKSILVQSGIDDTLAEQMAFAISGMKASMDSGAYAIGISFADILSSAIAQRMQNYKIPVELVGYYTNANSKQRRSTEGYYSNLDYMMENWDLYGYNPPGAATGTVIPPNHEFLARLGDNKTETEVVSPLSTMKQAFLEALSESGGYGSRTDMLLEELIDIVDRKNLVISPSSTLGRVVRDSEKMYARVTG